MRISGLASGMDVDSLVSDLMKAERMPLNKLQQDRQWLTWQRDAYREMNTLLSSFNNMFLDMKMSSTYQTKKTTSTQEQAVTATANTNVSQGSFSIEVTQLASAAINVSENKITKEGQQLDVTASLASQAEHFNGGFVTGTFTITTFDDNGQAIENEITVDENDSLNSILRKITDQDNGVRAFYDANSDRVFFERTASGSRNDGNEILFSGEASGFITETLGINPDAEQGGTNAQFSYNGVELESRTNSYTLNGLTLNFHSETNGIAVIGVQNDVDHSVDKIKEFVDKYNEIVETFNSKLAEKRYRDYPPLTDEQKEGMTEKEIELWEEKAMSGLLRSDPTLRSILSSMRVSLSSVVDTGNSDIKMLSDIGISVSDNYRDHGKLILDETKLREALQSDTTAVRRLFNHNTEDNSRGLINRIEGDVRRAMRNISDIAGSVNSTDQTHTMGRRLGDLETRISAFEQRLIQTENRYYRQFQAMEQAIQRANQQSMFLMQQFGGFYQQ